jgi:hypothetical protein
MIAVGLFVAALFVVGVLLLTGPDDDSDGNPASAAVTRTPTPGQSMLTPAGVTATPLAGSTAVVPTMTPAPVATPPAGTTPVPQVVETPAAGDAEATNEATEEPVESESTETPQPENPQTATSTEEPTVGDFGTLPPAQIVSGGLARNVDLDYELGISLDSVPSSAAAYRFVWAGWSPEEAASVAAKVGITADVDGSGGSYEIIGNEGELYISRTVVQYVNLRAPVGGMLEDNATVIENARIWLANSGITAGNVGPGSLIGRDDAAQRAVILFKPTNPAPLLAFYPSATVTIGPGGDVREANIRWPDGFVSSDYGMRSANQIWNDILAGEGSIEADLSDIPGSGPISGTFTVYAVSVAYSYAMAMDGSEYLVPLVVFSGEIFADEYGTSVPAWIYIQGIYGQSAPRG